MTTSDFLANRLKEVLMDGRWIANTNYKELLSDVTWEEAIQPVENLNTIAALTYHIYYYLNGISIVFDGGELTIKDKYSFDVPTIASKDDWQHLMTDFLIAAETFIKQVEQLPDNQWNKIFVAKEYGTYWRNIEGVIEHCYYHLGQMSLLKKLIQQKGS